MKIAMTLLSGVSYGGATIFNNLIPALATADSKNEYHLFVSEGHPLLNQVKQKNFIFHQCVGQNQSALKRFAWEQLILPLELKKYKIDVLFMAKNINILLARCRTIVALQNMEPLAYREYDNDWRLNAASWIKWQLNNLSVRKADHVVAVSQAVKDRAMRCFPGIEKKVSVVYNGNPVPLSQTTPRASLLRGGRTPEPFILTASKFVAYANQLNLIKAYRLLCEKNPNTPPLWFAGGVHDKKYFEKVQNFVNNNELKERVKFLGLVPQDRLFELMRRAQVFVFPSTLEACPHTPIEAMSCGAPIATSSTPPMPEICNDAASYFDPSSPDDIARAMGQLLTDDKKRDELRERGPVRAQFFNWDKTARSLIDIFKVYAVPCS